MLTDALIRAARTTPHAPAVGDGSRELTYLQFARLAGVLRDVIRSLTNCQRVGIMLPASTAFPAVFFGTLFAERIAVPLNFLLRAEELKKVVADADIEIILTVKHFAELASELPAKAIFLEDLPLKTKLLWAMLRGLPRSPTVDANSTAVILYTSGTTAEPKGVELTHGNLHSNCEDAIYSLEIEPGQSFLNVLPPFHVFGLTGNVIVPVYLAGRVLAIPRFSPLGMVRAVSEHKLSVILAIPSMFAAVLRTKSSRSDAFKSVYIAISGGEPLPDRVREDFKERFGVTLRQGYGLTETSPVISACSLSQYKVGTVGKPMRNVEVRIAGPEGETLGTDADGEIFVRGPGIMKGYFRKPEETRNILSSNGWFRTGDIGRIDADGFLAITGRAKEMLIIGGENVFPREIESVLESHEAVLQAAVIGMPDGLRGEIPVAFVMPRKDAEVSEDQLRIFARERLASFKTPKRVVIREDLPTGPTGKILKRRLKDLVERDPLGPLDRIIG
ncbi:MAG: AMP-binding protein [Planctomycetes bacterium]|nr:AMP-binding protein [Planctomycetota bacterium]MBI3835332.1 AMP-binding protein [Planctomycetota bacterium]